MPSFTGQLPNMVSAGPVAEIVVGPPLAMEEELKARNEPIPPPTRVAAMIDTGAAGTVISPAVVRELQLRPIGVVQISTPSTLEPVTARQFNIDILFPNGVTVNNVPAIEAPLGGQRIQCLIGRDILQHGVLVCIGYLNQFTLRAGPKITSHLPRGTRCASVVRGMQPEESEAGSPRQGNRRNSI